MCTWISEIYDINFKLMLPIFNCRNGLNFITACKRTGSSEKILRERFIVSIVCALTSLHNYKIINFM